MDLIFCEFFFYEIFFLLFDSLQVYQHYHLQVIFYWNLTDCKVPEFWQGFF